MTSYYYYPPHATQSDSHYEPPNEPVEYFLDGYEIYEEKKCAQDERTASSSEADSCPLTDDDIPF